jgi:hypothetical protein
VRSVRPDEARWLAEIPAQGARLMSHWISIILDKERNIALVTCIVTILFAFATIVGPAVAQKADKGVPKQQRILALGEDEIKQLLLLMDTDKNGRISKKEFMGFMEAEFERLDTDKNGELDVKELTKSQVRASRPAVGK